jgi:hypothetical protein
MNTPREEVNRFGNAAVTGIRDDGSVGYTRYFTQEPIVDDNARPLARGADTDITKRIEGSFYDNAGYLIVPDTADQSDVPKYAYEGLSESFFAMPDRNAENLNIQESDYRLLQEHETFMEQVDRSGSPDPGSFIEEVITEPTSTGGFGRLSTSGGLTEPVSDTTTGTVGFGRNTMDLGTATNYEIDNEPYDPDTDWGNLLAPWEEGFDEQQASLGYATGGIVGYAKGGEVIPDQGLTEYEESLVQGAIKVISGEIQDQAAAQEILQELERTFGEGAVQELMAEMQAQGGQPAQPDGMDDSVTANLTPGELIVSNPQLADYGNGDREAGAKKLQQHLADVSKAHRGTAATPSAVNPASLVKE